jgi:conjugative relaxase-like TrwC/TraI family protein
MLSTASMHGGSFRYYQNSVALGRCEYFLGVGEDPGRWYGRGIELLDLACGGQVSEAQLEALFGRALHPGTGEALGRRWRVDGVIGHDLCFSAPKSVSALWALGDGGVAAAVRAGHSAAVNSALDYLDRHASFSRTGRNGLTQVTTDGFTAAVFDHRTSRAGDPQLHSHALVVNKVRCGDGQWRTIDGTEIFHHKKSAGAMYQAALRSELTRRLGVSWTPVTEHGQAEIAGVPAELITAWSTRTRQTLAEAEPVIAGYAQTLGRPLTSAERTAVTKVAVLKTRPGKEHVDPVTLRERWATQAADLGWDGEKVWAAARRATLTRPPFDRQQAAADIDRTLADAVRAAGARRAVFSRSDLAAEVAARIPADGFTADMVRELIEHLTDQALPQAVRLRDHDDGPRRASDARYASHDTLDAELRILNRALTGRRCGYSLVPDELTRSLTGAAGLDSAQRVAVRVVAGSGDFLSVLVAPAGSGKTTAIGVAAAAWQQAGYRVIGLAPSARAAAELAAATGTHCETVAKFLHEQPRTGFDLGGGSPYRLAPRDVLIVDEASMLATADLDQLTALAADAGTKVTLVGDPYQLGSIDRAGGMLPVLADRLHSPSLEQVHRFDRAWERAASLLLRCGDPAALRPYVENDRIHPATSSDDAVDAAMSRWARVIDDGKNPQLLARSRRDVAALNQRARTHLIERGVVHGPILLDGGTDWRAGDQLRTTRNNRALLLGDTYVRNGDRFTVLARAAGGLVVEHIGGVRTTLPVAYVREHATYAWASTIDSAQGATVDIGILLARPGLDLEHLYVGLTRGRHANHVHVAPNEPAEDHHVRWAATTDQLAAEGILTDALTRTSRHPAAHTHLPEQIPTRSFDRVEPAARSFDPGRHHEVFLAHHRDRSHLGR